MIASRLKSFFGMADEDAETDADRRVDPRRKVLLKGEAFPVQGYAEVAIKNVSKTGLSGETDASLEVNSPLLFSLEGNTFHQGTVRWVRGRRFGLDLSDAFAIFGYEDDYDTGFADAHQRRARRHDVDVKGRIALTSKTLRVTVRDVSRSGMCLDSVVPFANGQQVLIRLRDRPLILAGVQWVAGGKAGIKTAERIETLRLVYAND
jgi:hypothetical protein